MSAAIATDLVPKVLPVRQQFAGDVTESLLLLWISVVGTVFPALNPDAAVVIYVLRGHPPLAAALLAFCGQLIALFAVHLLGGRLRGRWRWLDRKCETFRCRWGRRLEQSTLVVAALSGLTGIPPGVPTIIVAAALGLPARHYLPVFFLGRAGWFVALALVGSAFSG